MPEIEVNGTRLCYRLEGPEEADAVVLSNSLGTSLEMWDAQMPALRDRFRVLCYDSRGHGRSAAPAGDYTIDLLAADALGLMDLLGIERAHFVGVSKGGMVGQLLAARHGGRFKSLILCSTACHLPPAELWDERVRTARERGMAPLVDAVVERWFTAGFRKSGDAALEVVRRMILETPGEGYAGCCAAIRDMDLRDVIGGIRVPTLVVVGADDPATPPDKAREIRDRIRDAELEVIEDAAHLLNIEQPVVFNHLMIDFIDRHR